MCTCHITCGYWCVHVTLHVDTGVYMSHYMWILVCTCHITCRYRCVHVTLHEDTDVYMSHYMWILVCTCHITCRYRCVHVTLHEDTDVYMSHYMRILMCTSKAQNLKHFMIVTEAWVMVERKQLYYIVSCSHLIFLLRVWFTWFLFVALYYIRLHGTLPYNTVYHVSPSVLSIHCSIYRISISTFMIVLKKLCRVVYRDVTNPTHPWG